MTAPERPAASLDAMHAALFAFLDDALGADLAGATERGDEGAQRFLRQTMAIVDGIRSDLVEDPRRAVEVDRFLCRTAAGYRGHPGFDGSWLLFV